MLCPNTSTWARHEIDCRLHSRQRVAANVYAGIAHSPIFIVNCRLVDHRGWAIVFENADATHFAVFAVIDDVVIEKPNVTGGTGGGMWLRDLATTTVYCSRCRIDRFAGHGVLAERVQALSLRDTIIRNGDGTKPFLKLFGCQNAHVERCAFEHSIVSQGGGVATPAEYLIDVERDPARQFGDGIVLESCRFLRGFTGPTPSHIVPKGIRVRAPATNVRISNPYVESPRPFSGNAIVLDYGPADAYVEAILFGGSGKADGVLVPIPISDPTENRAMALGTNQLLRLPRVSEADKAGLVNVGLGDLIYNTTHNRAEVFVDAPPPASPWLPLN